MNARPKIALAAAAAALVAVSPLAGSAHADETQKLPMVAAGSDTVIGKMVLSTSGTTLTSAIHVSGLVGKTEYRVFSGRLNDSCTGPLAAGTLSQAATIVTGASGAGSATTSGTLPRGSYNGISVFLVRGYGSSSVVVGGAGHCFTQDFTVTVG